MRHQRPKFQNETSSPSRHRARAWSQKLSLLFALILLHSCFLTDQSSSDRVLFGFTLDEGTSGPGSATISVTQATCSSDITVSATAVDIIEDGDVTRNWQAASPGFSDTDADGGTAWGLRSAEVCVYLPTAFNGTVEIPVATNGTYAGRLDALTSFPTAGNPIPSVLTFTGDGTTGHGSGSRQCFRFTRIQDAAQNAKEDPYLVTLGTITSDTSEIYTGKNPCDIAVAMEDDESPGVRVSNISQIMEEPGGSPTSATFSVQLRTVPTSSVTVGINDTYDSANANHREGTTTPTSLNFVDTTPQNVTINSVDDLEIDGLKAYVVDVTAASSSDSNYNGIEPRNVTVYNQDKSVPGYNYVLFSSTSGSTGTGGGAVNGFAVDQANNMGSTYGNFTLALRSKPTDDVVLTFSNSNTNVANLLTTTLTFTTSNWNTAQTVRVEGKSDAADGGSGNGNIDFTISFNATSTDTTYNTTVTEPTFNVRSCDNDNTHLIQPCNFSGTSYGDTRSRLTGAEPSATSQIWLITKSNPGGSASVGLTSTDTSEGTVAGSVSIDSSTYNTMTTGGSNRIAISHADDSIVDGTQNFTVTTAAATGALSYDSADILGATTDNEQYYYISKSGATSEASTGTVATIYVCLGASNDSAVKLDLACSGDECGSLSAASLNWTTGLQSDATSNATCTSSSTNVRSFTVNGADDSFADGAQNFTVTLTVDNGTTTGNYNGQSPSNQSVSNADDEPAGKAIFVTTGTYNGEMTAAGVKGGDSICTTNKPGYAPTGTYKALLVGIGETNTRLATTSGTDATGQADWVLTAGRYYYRCESGSCSDEVSHLFIADSSGLFNPNTMSRDFSSSANEYWTGLNTNLTMATQSSTPAQGSGDPANRHNCAGFTYANAPASPFPTYYAETWTDAGGGTVTTSTNVACTNSKRIICVQQ